MILGTAIPLSIALAKSVFGMGAMFGVVIGVCLLIETKPPSEL